MGGSHCITNSLKQIFCFNDYPISEEMLFGIGRALSFVYINLKDSPLISGRIKPLEFENNIAAALNISIKCRQSKNHELATKKLHDQIKNNIPVMIYVDMAYLKYMNLSENNHFGGHSVVVFGFDDEKNCFYISDRDSSDNKIHTPKGKIGNDFHLVSYDELKIARNSNYRPFPANNKWLQFNFSGAIKINTDILKTAIFNNVNSMLNAPAQLLGMNGIYKFSKEVRKWKNFDENKLKLAGITNYFMISADGGTGGGAFRNMYGKFLIESSFLLNSREIADIGEKFIQIAKDWDKTANSLKMLYETGNVKLLNNISNGTQKIADAEKESLTMLLKAIE